MHTEPAVIAERGARCAHPTHPLAAVSGAVEVFAVELPRLRMLPSMPRLGACVANATVRLQAPDEALRVRAGHAHTHPPRDAPLQYMYFMRHDATVAGGSYAFKETTLHCVQ